MDILEWEGTQQVWSYNLEESFRMIRDIVPFCPYVAINTKYPGNLVIPWTLAEFTSVREYLYNYVKSNAEAVKVVQMGLSFFNEQGMPKKTFQFNFKFDVLRDRFNEQSMHRLRHDSQIDFFKHTWDGINPELFGELLLTSGAVLYNKATWICYQGCADMAYLCQMLTGGTLPDSELLYLKLLRQVCPNIYDIRQLLKEGDVQVPANIDLYRISAEVGINNNFPLFKAGFDSLLTGRLYFRLKHLGIVTPKEGMRYGHCI